MHAHRYVPNPAGTKIFYQNTFECDLISDLKAHVFRLVTGIMWDVWNILLYYDDVSLNSVGIIYQSWVALSISRRLPVIHGLRIIPKPMGAYRIVVKHSNVVICNNMHVVCILYTYDYG